MVITEIKKRWEAHNMIILNATALLLMLVRRKNEKSGEPSSSDISWKLRQGKCVRFFGITHDNELLDGSK